MKIQIQIFILMLMTGSFPGIEKNGKVFQATKCEYILSMPERLNNKEIKVSKISFKGCNRTSATKMRKRLELKMGEKVTLNKRFLDDLVSPICSYKRLSLGKIGVLNDTFFGGSIALIFEFKRK